MELHLKQEKHIQHVHRVTSEHHGTVKDSQEGRAVHECQEKRVGPPTLHQWSLPQTAQVEREDLSQPLPERSWVEMPFGVQSRGRDVRHLEALAALFQWFGVFLYLYCFSSSSALGSLAGRFANVFVACAALSVISVLCFGASDPPYPLKP